MPPKPTKSNFTHLMKLMEEEKRLDIMSRFWSFKKLATVFKTSHVHVLLTEKREEIEQFVFGTNDLVKLGLKWGVLEEHPTKTKKKEAKKLKKEIKGFF